MLDRWEVARNHSLPALQELGQVLMRVRRLVEVEPSALFGEEKTEITNLQRRVQTQVEKLKANEFHIAVVGLEKAGKSTFLNAWLKCDLLPNEQERCTYTNTEIRSTNDQAQGTFTVEFQDDRSFEEARLQYEKLAQGKGTDADAARADLNDINKWMPTIREHLNRPPLTVSFSQLEAPPRFLQDYIANPQVSRAIKGVRISTCLLQGTEGLVFHDVPGWDSPFSLLRERARQELARADAIIFVTNVAANVDLTDGQLRMLEVADEEDPDIHASDKMFVFLNKVDAALGKDDLESRVQKARKKWSEPPRQYCPAERVVPGSSGAYLIKNTIYIDETTRKELGPVVKRLEEVSAPFGDGMEHLQGLLRAFLDTDRTEVMRRRTQNLLQQGKSLAGKALERLAGRFPESTKELDIQQQAQAEAAFNKWFDRRWLTFQEAFGLYWQNEVEPSESDEDYGAPPRLEQMHQAYVQAIDALRTGFPTPEVIHQIHAQVRGPHPVPVEADFEVRRRIREDHVDPRLDGFGEQVADVVLEIVKEIGNEVVRHFCDVEGVRRHVYLGISPAEYRALLVNGLRTLFLRYARPAVYIFLRTPRGIPDRSHLISTYEKEIRILETYYDGPSQRKHLGEYLRTGRWPVVPPEVEAVVRQVGQEVAAQAVGRALGTPVVGPTRDMIGELIDRNLVIDCPAPARVADVETEVAEDCDALLDYLRRAVFGAAAFSTFLREELRRIRNYLLSKNNLGAKHAILDAICEARARQHPGIVREIGQTAADIEKTRQAVVRMTDLRASLGKLDQLATVLA